MRLYLVRHGKARPKPEDPSRHLSPEGVAQVRKVADFLRPHGLHVGAIWHSTKARAVETAQVLATAVTADAGMLERDDLAPNDDIDPVRRDIERAEADLVIVGHLPFLDDLASKLVAGNESADVLAFPEAGLACLDYQSDSGWRVVWMVTPEVLP